MPRLKRAQRLAKAEVKPAPKPTVIGVVATEVKGAFCPCCGRVIPEKRAIKAGYVTVDHIGYFASIDWDPNKPFGVSYPATGKDVSGRGPTQNWRYINPEDAPELFEAMKGRFLQALGEWIKKGWIEKEELP